MGAPDATTWTKESTAGRLSQLLAVPVSETRTPGKCTTSESTVRNRGAGGGGERENIGVQRPLCKAIPRTHKTKPLWVSVLQKQKNRLEALEARSPKAERICVNRTTKSPPIGGRKIVIRFQRQAIPVALIFKHRSTVG